MGKGLGLAGLGVLLGLAGCGLLATDPPETAPSQIPSETPTSEPTPNLVYDDITLTKVQPSGRVLWRLQANFARYKQEQAIGNAELDRVVGEIYDEEDHPIRVQARSGAVYPEEPRLELRDEVQVESAIYRVSVTADRVEWLPEEDRLLATGNVVIRSLPEFSAESSPAQADDPSDIVDVEATGQQLTFDLERNHLSLTHGPETRPVELTAVSPPLDLKALTLNWDLRAEQLTAEGQVEGLHRPRQVLLTGDTLIAPLVEPQIAVVGNAEAVGQASGQQLRADQLLWDTSTPIIEAQGNVSYRQPSQDLTLTGTSGSLNWETSSAAVRGGTTTTQIQIPQ